MRNESAWDLSGKEAQSAKVDLETCMAVMTTTPNDMIPKYKETSEAGPKALVLCIGTS